MTSRNLLVFSGVALVALGCPRKEEPSKEPAAKERAGHAGHEHEKESATKNGEHEGEGHQEGEGHEEHGEGKEHEELITLKPAAIASAQLKTAKVEHRALASGLKVPARISFTQTGVAKVASRVPGRLVSLEVQLGQKVKKGQVLGYLESSSLGQARADYLSAATKSRVAEANFRREKELVTKGISSEREMRDAESAFATAQAEMNAAEGRLHALGLSDPEIRALKAMGADAVGMSTAVEAERAAELGLEVAAISCITNKAAGLSAGVLDHAEVLDNAKLAVERLEAILVDVVKA